MMKFNTAFDPSIKSPYSVGSPIIKASPNSSFALKSIIFKLKSQQIGQTNLNQDLQIRRNNTNNALTISKLKEDAIGGGFVGISGNGFTEHSRDLNLGADYPKTTNNDIYFNHHQNPCREPKGQTTKKFYNEHKQTTNDKLTESVSILASEPMLVKSLWHDSIDSNKLSDMNVFKEKRINRKKSMSPFKTINIFTGKLDNCQNELYFDSRVLLKATKRRQMMSIFSPRESSLYSKTTDSNITTSSTKDFSRNKNQANTDYIKSTSKLCLKNDENGQIKLKIKIRDLEKRISKISLSDPTKEGEFERLTYSPKRQKKVDIRVLFKEMHLWKLHEDVWKCTANNNNAKVPSDYEKYLIPPNFKDVMKSLYWKTFKHESPILEIDNSNILEEKMKWKLIFKLAEERWSPIKLEKNLKRLKLSNEKIKIKLANISNLVMQNVKGFSSKLFTSED